ncbi:MAG: hypothetical protein M3015_00320 [Bacteroidota bacterium]|nr:hypothetical protein [Bacteroidota bacterium]
MDTTKRGTTFEIKVHDLIIKMIQEDKFFIDSKNYKLYLHKKYYSTARQAKITVDLSMEYFREGGLTPNLYILMECKDCQRPVPVDDIEEFYSKSLQLTGLNVKCIFFTTSSLQSSAFNYALSKGIAVIRILDDDSMMWLIERTNKNLTTSLSNSIVINVTNALTNEYFVSTKKNIFGFYNTKPFITIEELFMEILMATKEDK